MCGIAKGESQDTARVLVALVERQVMTGRLPDSDYSWNTVTFRTPKRNRFRTVDAQELLKQQAPLLRHAEAHR